MAVGWGGWGLVAASAGPGPGGGPLQCGGSGARPPPGWGPPCAAAVRAPLKAWQGVGGAVVGGSGGLFWGLGAGGSLVVVAAIVWPCGGGGSVVAVAGQVLCWGWAPVRGARGVCCVSFCVAAWSAWALSLLIALFE